VVSRFEYVELTVDFAANTWRDSTGRAGPLPMSASQLAWRKAGFRPKRPRPLDQVEELTRQFRAEGWADMAVLAYGTPGLYTATFRRAVT
jgi:hypothetical protein